MTKETPDYALYAEEYRKDAQRIVEVLATELEATAAHLRRTAAAFTSGQSTASGTAATIVSDYTIRNGNGSVRLWSIVDNAGRADAATARVTKPTDCSESCNTP